MKKLLLLPTIFLFISCASYTPVEMSPLTQQFQIDKEKDELYISANNWMVENFNNAKSVIQFSDKESGTVTGKYLLKETYTYSGYTASEVGIYAIIKLQVKDGAAKITVTSDNFQSVTSTLVDEQYRYGKEDAEAQVNGLISSFEQYILNDTSGNW